MVSERTAFQGLVNILRFNWHFYAFAIGIASALLLINACFPSNIYFWVNSVVILVFLNVLVSLIVSWYIYDLSGFYQLEWLDIPAKSKILNIHAGFDETSILLKTKFPETDIFIADFYDPDLHTEISIKRARKLYPPAAGTIRISNGKLPFPDNTFDQVLIILSAHEIRNASERTLFFNELARICIGRIVVVEHLRDRNNILAYTLGAFHFHSKKTWLQSFDKADLSVQKTYRLNPFITAFILEKRGITL